MRDTRYIILVLLSSLLMLTGCSRRDVLDDYPVSGVEISLDWAGVTDELPEGVRIIFYPKDGEGRKVDRYLSVQGGEMKVPPGRYSVVAYNYNTEVVRIRGEESYETRHIRDIVMVWALPELKKWFGRRTRYMC